MRAAGTVLLPQRRDPAGLVGWECVGSVLAASVLGVSVDESCRYSVIASEA
jgi:hypothetical protein